MIVVKSYDVVVVGAGVGGCAMAYRLCSSGKNVLLLEKGSSSLKQSQNIDKPILFCRNNIEETVKNVPLAEGPGGNSLIYGGQLSRFDRSCFQSDTGESTTFPFTYSEIESYYSEIEALFVGEELALSGPDKKVLASFEKCGFESLPCTHAVSFFEGCDGCGGKLCKRKCKKDFYSVLCANLVKSGFLAIEDGVQIKHIEIVEGNVTSISYNLKGVECEVRTNALVFSAGALRTPELIQRHLSGAITNDFSNKIGKGLAFHVSDFYLLYPKFIMSGAISTAKLLNGRLSCGQAECSSARYTVQSVGAPVKKEYIERFILRRLPGRLALNPVMRHLVGAFSKVAEWLGSRSHVVATIVQDPMLEVNRVEGSLNLPNLKVSYSQNGEFIASIKQIDKQLRNALKMKFFIFRLGGQGNINYGHPMGGCAMGDAEMFPVDKTGRLKQLQNVYIGDASIFPISGDTNPSLTIAAVAFRTADQLLAKI